MKRCLSALLLILCITVSSPVDAQDPEVRVESGTEPVLVGQPFLVRVDVLVPTFMPKPPVFPTFESPGLLVRLPEKSTSPISERISGDTWSGVRRTYRIYPMREGVTNVPAQNVAIVYKNPTDNQDTQFSAELPAFDITATVPEAAAGLDPMILAQQIDIEQSWEIAEGGLSVGDSVVRSLEIKVTGTSALFVPPLLEASPPVRERPPADDTVEQKSPFSIYPEDAKVSEHIDRGLLSGSRLETTTYIAQNAGDIVFPDIKLRWFNIDSGAIEDISLPGRNVTIAQPPKQREPLDGRAVIRVIVIALIACLAAFLFFARLFPKLQRGMDNIRQSYADTAHASHRRACKMARSRDLSKLLAALDELAERGTPLSPLLKAALDDLMQKKYRSDTGFNDVDAQWRDVVRSLRGMRPPLLRRGHRAAAPDLPRLNSFDSLGR